MYGNVFAFLGIDNNAGSGRVTFLNGDGSWFQTLYCSASNFYLEAYDINGSLLDSEMGGANLRYSNGALDMGTLRVESASSNIAYVIMHDTGNYWLADNMSGDATGVGNPIPEPGTLLLLGTGLLGLGAFIRRK